MERILNIRKTILMDCAADATLMKAVSMLLRVKFVLPCSRIDNLSLNKLHTITGAHPHTLKKYIARLNEYGLIAEEGNKTVFLSVSSRHKLRNCCVEVCDNDSLKNIQRKLQSICLVIFQNKKDYLHHTLLLSMGEAGLDGKIPNLRQVKSARKKCRALGIRENFKDYGISYRGIAKKLHCCSRTAFDIVKYAVSNLYLNMKRNLISQKREDAYSFFHFADNNFNFVVSNTLYRVCNNTYTIAKNGIKALGVGAMIYVG